MNEKGIPIRHIIMDKFNLEENSIHFGHIIVDSTNWDNDYLLME